MASGASGDAVRQINRLFRDGTNAALTDGQLLERFTTRRPEAAEAAFESLVSRHGPMVLRVCRGVLRDTHDVEDAFQATFLVLVRKAHSIGERDLLGPWLYGVAHRVALKARGVAAKRNKREGGAFDDPPADVNEGPWLDLRPMLHEELNRLPEKYRKPVVLCHLQGLTHAEAAQELAWPVGTVSVRLARARKLLKERLTRRGLTVTATLWAAGLSLEGATAAVPESLIRSTAQAALQAATGKLLAAGAVSAGAITLSKRTLTTMLVSRLKWLVVPLTLALGATGGVVVNRQIMSRSIEAKANVALAAEEASKPPTALPDPNAVPEAPGVTLRRSPFGRSPFELDGPDERGPLEMPDEVPIKVEPPLVFRNGRIELDPPPGYFDLPAPNKNDGTDPPIIKPGQILQVEVLEGLPGRPITGERVVRPDGTISLGFYGDLKVAGLNRNQIKVKLIQHMCQYLNDEVLGLLNHTRDGIWKAIPPVESNRVMVDESFNYYPAGQENAARPAVKVGFPDQAPTNARINELDKKLDRVIQELEQLRGGRRPADAPRDIFDAASPRPAPPSPNGRNIDRPLAPPPPVPPAFLIPAVPPKE